MVATAKTSTGLKIALGLSVLTGLASLRYWGVPFGQWPGIGPEITGVIRHVPVQALTHMLIAPIALITGPFNFFTGIRLRHPRWHRWNGRVYVAACIVAGIGALATAPFASGGPIAGWGFGILAVLWITTTLWAWRAAVARNFELHRRLMRYSFAMTFAAVTLRLQMPLGFIFFHFTGYGPMSVYLAWTCWIPNVLAVALYDLYRAARGPALQAAE